MYSSDEPTFQQNMENLYRIKQQLLKLNHIYSPDSVNYHQLTLIEKLRKEIHNSQATIQIAQNSLKQKNKKLQIQLNTLTAQKEELEEVNLKLVQNNEQMIRKFENVMKQLEESQEDLLIERKQKEELHEKYGRQMENLKLLYNQEIYILKKKDKKNHG